MATGDGDLGAYAVRRLCQLRSFGTSKPDMTLGVVERDTPAGSSEFFQAVLKGGTFGEVMGLVDVRSAKAQIRSMLDGMVPEGAERAPMMSVWLADMARVVGLFSHVVGDNEVCVWLGSERGCEKFHVDAVPYRGLVTYLGVGTEWVPNDALDRAAFQAGREPDDFVLDATRVQFLREWDVALFRGGSSGVVHRTPVEALDAPSVFMRLDVRHFWDQVIEDWTSDQDA